jgi:hypothetical protein
MICKSPALAKAETLKNVTAWGILGMQKTPEERCSDSTEEIVIRIPCALAERLSAYARENDSTVSGAAIEALDFFLRQRPMK